MYAAQMNAGLGWLVSILKGYGKFYIKRRNYRAHRVAFFLTHHRWPMPCCLHTCDNPGCQNPRHLREGTTIDNVHDKMTKGRWRNQHGGQRSLWSGVSRQQMRIEAEEARRRRKDKR